MTFGWYNCELCGTTGKVDIGDNFNKFKKIKSLQCPACNGKGKLVIKPMTNTSNKRWQIKPDSKGGF
jgi:DnaJ-class molecular chaperone